MGWWYNAVIEHILIHEALGSVPSTTKKKRKEERAGKNKIQVGIVAPSYNLSTPEVHARWSPGGNPGLQRKILSQTLPLKKGMHAFSLDTCSFPSLEICLLKHHTKLYFLPVYLRLVFLYVFINPNDYFSILAVLIAEIHHLYFDFFDDRWDKALKNSFIEEGMVWHTAYSLSTWELVEPVINETLFHKNQTKPSFTKMLFLVKYSNGIL